jgi:hypothetical protein
VLPAVVHIHGDELADGEPDGHAQLLADAQRQSDGQSDRHVLQLVHLESDGHGLVLRHWHYDAHHDLHVVRDGHGVSVADGEPDGDAQLLADGDPDGHGVAIQHGVVVHDRERDARGHHRVRRQHDRL